VFTDRFIRVPIKEYSVKTKELTGDEGELIDNWEKINPFEIQAYRPYVDNPGAFFLKLKGQDTFTVYMPIKEFEAMLNKMYAH
jgi:hypothetical protein